MIFYFQCKQTFHKLTGAIPSFLNAGTHFSDSVYIYVYRSDVYASQRWYYWKAKPEQVTAITKMFPWLCYSVHMLSVWLVLYLQHKANEK